MRTDLKKVIKDTLVTMPARPRNFRLRKTLSLQVIQTWLEMLRLEERGIRWLYWDIPQQELSSLFEKYRLSDCMGISPPYTKSKFACETFLKTSERYLSQADIDENVLEWVNGDSAPAGMRDRLDAFLSQGQEEGVKSLITEKSKNLLCMLEFMTSKQTLGEGILTAHEQFISTHHVSVRSRDRIIREECTKDQGIADIKKAIAALHTLFEKCKGFFVKEPGQEAYDAAILTLGPHPIEETLNTVSLQLILEQVGPHSPRVMLHVNPTVGELQDEQLFADLMENLLDENVRVSELNIIKEEKSKERNIKA